ncbi:hypothetical protein [Thermococcus piezophilus]|uniref:hypothetical protein n=1 Tax=Thermococcus piezophilus TaxID=1712654 RepID=UPI000A7017F7|nr:hypothetical protein [Thermococcus piezophilus]
MIEDKSDVVEDFKVRIYFPGCIISHSKVPTEGTEYDVLYPWATVIVDGWENYPNCYGFMLISADRLSKDDAIIMNVLVDTNTSGKIMAFLSDKYVYSGSYT